jgi:hypothetical protein
MEKMSRSQDERLQKESSLERSSLDRLSSAPQSDWGDGGFFALTFVR